MARFAGFPCPSCGVRVASKLSGGLLAMASPSRVFQCGSCGARLVHSASTVIRARAAIVLYTLSLAALPGAFSLVALGYAGSSMLTYSIPTSFGLLVFGVLVTARSSESTPYEEAKCA